VGVEHREPPAMNTVNSAGKGQSARFLSTYFYARRRLVCQVRKNEEGNSWR
jgi:hypothetical protein